jgi:choline-sulfatase
MSDEHRADVAGYAGDPVIRTPVLDSLARTGVVFRNAYTPSPICAPGRQCLMSGQLPRTCGCEVWGDDLAPGYMTWARRFSEHAYAAVACGKLHHMGMDQMQGWTHRVAGDMAVDPKFLSPRDEEAFARHVPSLGSQKWSDAKEVLRAGVGRARHIVNDAYVVQGALNFIEHYFVDSYYDKATSDRPLLLKVSLAQPHYPYLTGSEEKFGYYLNRVQPFLDQPGLDSRSLAGLLRGETGNWNNETVVLFDLRRNPEETVNYIAGAEYAEPVAHFRARLAALGHGPNADPRYVNAGYG